MSSIHRQDRALSYEDIPLDDPATYRMLNSGQTIGVFQLESPAQRALQARLGASDIEDIVASVAIIRPGPIKGNMVEPYIARRQGREPVTYLHPALQPILEKTYGVVLFQEQVIEIAIAVAGFTPGEADRLRRVMTHARSQRAMEEIGDEFIARAVKNGVELKQLRPYFPAWPGMPAMDFAGPCGRFCHHQLQTLTSCGITRPNSTLLFSAISPGVLSSTLSAMKLAVGNRAAAA